MSAPEPTVAAEETPAADQPPKGSRWSGWWSGLRRTDPIAWGSFLVAAVVYSLQGFAGMLDRDPAVYVYGGQRFAEGSLPYVDIVNRAGPLAHAFPGFGVIGARIVGATDVEGVRFLFMLISAACVAAVYVLGRDLSRSRLVGLLSAACLLTFEAFSHYAAVGPREKTVMVLFATWGLIACTRQRWLAVGVWIALATLTWQPVFFAAGLATAAAIAFSVPVREWWRAALRVAIGGAIPTAITVVIYAVAGELKVFVDCFYLINSRYTSQPSAFGHLGRAWDKVENGYGWSAWLFAAGLVGALVLAVLAVLRPGSASRAERGGALAVGVFVVGGTAWSLHAFDNWPDTMVLMPVAAVGAGGLVGLALRPLTGRVALGVTAALTAAALVSAVAFSLDHRYTGIHREQAIAEAAVDAVPGATILALEAPQPLVLTQTTNISRFHLYSNGMMGYIADTWPGGRRGYVNWLIEQRPTLIAVGRPERPWFPRVTEGYVQVSQDSQWEWWVSPDVPQEQLDAVIAAIDAANERYGTIQTW